VYLEEQKTDAAAVIFMFLLLFLGAFNGFLRFGGRRERRNLFAASRVCITAVLRLTAENQFPVEVNGLRVVLSLASCSLAPAAFLFSCGVLLSAARTMIQFEAHRPLAWTSLL
jgi:hypothetical protein